MNSAVLPLASHIISNVEKVCGSDCLRYIDNDRLKSTVQDMLKKNNSPSIILESMSSELIVHCFSKKHVDTYGTDMPNESVILASLDLDDKFPNGDDVPPGSDDINGETVANFLPAVDVNRNDEPLQATNNNLHTLSEIGIDQDLLLNIDTSYEPALNVDEEPRYSLNDMISKGARPKNTAFHSVYINRNDELNYNDNCPDDTNKPTSSGQLYLTNLHEFKNDGNGYNCSMGLSNSEQQSNLSEVSPKQLNDSEANDWVRVHASAASEMFPKQNVSYLRWRCNKINGDEEKFIDLLNELVESGAEISEPLSACAPSSTTTSQQMNDQDRDEKAITDLLIEDSTAIEDEFTCGVCYDDFCLSELLHCSDPSHLYCYQCVKKYVETEMGEGRYSFNCMADDGCPFSYSLNVLYNVLDEKTFDIMQLKKQEFEITTANIPNLESCPFCNFAIEFDEKATYKSEHTVLRCDNPKCKKKSCRLCKKADHSPNKCEEREDQKDARKMLENEMTEAMVRKCYKCNKRFIQQDGCNKMTCSCGAIMCYLCKQPIQDYNHFKKGKCELYNKDLQGLHAQEVKQRAEQVKRNIDTTELLVHDPTLDTSLPKK